MVVDTGVGGQYTAQRFAPPEYLYTTAGCRVCLVCQQHNGGGRSPVYQAAFIAKALTEKDRSPEVPCVNEFASPKKQRQKPARAVRDFT